MCLCAKRNSGKSVLLRYLVKQHRDDFSKIFVVCPSEEVNHFYTEFIDKRDIFPKYQEDWVLTLMKKLEGVNSKNEKDNFKRILLILDDCCSDVDFHHSDSLKRIFTRGRHCGLALIITAQYVYQLPPVCRSNCDYMAVSQMNRQGLEILTNDFLMGNITKDEFYKMYYRCTSNYGFLLINNNSASDNNNLDEIYGVLKTPNNFIK
jgi:hypothetical protein